LGESPYFPLRRKWGGIFRVIMPEASSTHALELPASDVESKVEAEMTRLLYRQAGFGLFSNLVLAFVLVAGVWSYFRFILKVSSRLLDGRLWYR
jgi:hypothetical protein